MVVLGGGRFLTSEVPLYSGKGTRLECLDKTISTLSRTAITGVPRSQDPENDRLFFELVRQ